MMRSLAIGALLLAVSSGCSRSNPAELLETARFEEKQTNLAHARELYQRIVAEHPSSAEATEAKARLSALDAAPSDAAGAH